MTTEELGQALRRALVTRFGVRQAIEDDTTLFSAGLMDSLTVIELVSFIEEQIGCGIPPAAITLQNFDSISRIVQFASSLRAKGHVK
jgi:D-alanine--poly(phosphoribitol) ligase subunit 2